MQPAVQIGCLPSISKTSTRCPVELERTRRVWHRCAVHGQCFGRSLRAGKVDETISGVTAVIRMRQDSRTCFLNSYPENLSRIILTLTCSPIWNQRLRTKFSSIHGSSSPILGLSEMSCSGVQSISHATADLEPVANYSPQRRLLITTLSTTWRTTVTGGRTLELSLRLISRLSTHLTLLRSWRAGTWSAIWSCRVLVLVVVLIRHFWKCSNDVTAVWLFAELTKRMMKRRW